MGKARNEDCGPMDLNSLQFNIIRLELEEDASHTALSLVYMAIVYFLWPCRSRSALSGTRPLLVSMVYVFQSFPSSLSDLTVRRERHRAYGEIYSRSRRMVVPFDESGDRFGPRQMNRSRIG